MNLPYAIVQFLKEGTYSEIPTLWLTNNLTQCRWPITKNPTIFIKKSSPPKADWLLLDVKVECYCETLEKAQKQAEDANYAFEIRGCGKRIIHEKQFNDTCTYDDSIDDDCGPQKKLKTDVNRDSEKESFCDKQFLQTKQSSYEKVSQTAKRSFSANRSLCDKSQTLIVDPLQAGDFNKSTTVESEIKVQNPNFISTIPLATIGENIEKLIPICMETLKYVKSIDQRLKALEKAIGIKVEESVTTFERNIINVEEPITTFERNIINVEEPITTFERNVINVEEPMTIFERNINIEKPINTFEGKLPINSIQNLKKFEEDMENAETRTNFIEFMKKIGGKDNKNMVQRCLNRLFTNEFGKACSWLGRRNNYRMCDLKCICILKSVLTAKGVDECDFETIASEWFRLSKMRYDRENKKGSISVEEGLSSVPSASASEIDPLYIPFAYSSAFSAQYTSEQNVEESIKKDKASFIWSSKNIYLLLAKYEERMNEFSLDARHNSKIWESIASDMNKVDPEIAVSGTQCWSKMNSMKEIYRKIVDNNTENIRKPWQYFERMYELFGKLDWENLEITASEVGSSSTLNSTENRNIKEISITKKSESEKLLDEFVNQMRQERQEREKMKEEKKLIILQELQEQKEKRHKEKIDIMKKFCEAVAGKKIFD
ncbi:uncharacterized protein LOC105839990 isoform X2 [Monomorium pharaonis]|nr:uncharacterized protein LOC105839990 isoform X2 [Monomorium pharaonis]